MAWWEYIPGVSAVGNAAQGDWGEAAVGLTPFAPIYQGGKDIYQSNTFQNEVLPAMGFKEYSQDRDLRNRMDEARQRYAEYRPEIAQARMQAMQQTASMMEPYNRLMEQMYGQGAAPDMSQVFQNPLPQQQTGAPPGAFGPPPKRGQ